MMAKTHATFGMTIGLAYYSFVQNIEVKEVLTNMDQLKDLGIVFLGLYFGSLLPDIDHPKSVLGRKIKPVSYFLNQTIGHRTFTHSLLSVGILMTFCFLLKYNYSEIFWVNFIFAITIGWMGHLLLDALTVRGIPLLYPFIKNRYSIGRFRTNSLGESAFMILLTVGNIFLLIG